MGQYHYICNLDKHQYLDPHAFGDGIKLMEFGNSMGGTLTGLSILLAVSNGRGGGDLRYNDDLIGSWGGDRIAIIGDYFEPQDVPGFTDVDDTPWSNQEAWQNISAEVRHLIEQDGCFSFEVKQQEYRDLDGNTSSYESVSRLSRL